MLCIKPNKNEKMVRDQKFLKTLLGKLDRGEIRRDFWLQRKSTQWNNQIRDQAIVTTVQGEDIDPVKICEEIREGKPSQKWIVDGGNRFEAWNTFYNNVFALGKNLENYIVPYEATKKDENGNVVKDEDGYPIMEELEFDLRGKRYKDLPLELKERFNNYKVIYVEHSNCTESRMGYHIRRYNNQKSMNKNQKSVTYMEQTAKWTKEIMRSNPFFKELPCYHGASEKNSDPERVMLDTVMIIFFKDEWKSNAEKNALYVETNGEKEQFNLLDNYLGRMYALVEDNDELSKLFEKKDAPMWIALFDKFSKLEMDDSKFKEFLEAFISGLRETKINGESFDEIKGNKSTKNRNTIFGKLEYLESLMMDFFSIDKNDIIDSFETTDRFDAFATKFENTELMEALGVPMGSDIDRIAAQTLMTVCGKTDFSDKAIQEFITADEYTEDNIEDVDLYLDEVNEWSLELPAGTTLLKAKYVPAMVGFVKYTYDNDTNTDALSWFKDYAFQCTKPDNDVQKLLNDMKEDFNSYLTYKENKTA